MHAFRAIAVLAIVIASGCGGGSDGTTPPRQTPPPGGTGGGTGGTGGSTSNAISVKDNFFDPDATTIAVGTTVTWSWDGADIHNVTFSGGGPNSGDMGKGGSFQRVFSAAGTFNYSCTRHGGMNGTITVK